MLVIEADAFRLSSSPGHWLAPAIARLPSVKLDFIASSRTDPKRIVHCATDSKSVSNISLFCSSSCREVPRALFRLTITDDVVCQFNREARQATIKRALIGLLSPNHEPSAKPAKTAAAVG